MNKAFAIVGALSLAHPATARAQIIPDMIEVRAIDDASGRGSIAWTLEASGAVVLVTTICRDCRNSDPQHRTFAIAQEEAARLLARLPKSEIDAALRAPCTLPTATSGWAQRIDLNYRLPGGGGSYTGFFGNCRSPQLDRLQQNLREVGESLIALEPPATTSEP